MSSWTIAGIDLYKIDIPLKKPFVFALETVTNADNLLVVIRTNDEKIFGIGEVSPFPTILGETREGQIAIASKLGKQMIGLDPMNVGEILDGFDQVLVGNFGIKSAFDIALHDLSGKIQNIPLWQMLGGTQPKQIQSGMTVSLGNPNDMAEEAKSFVAAGFKDIKVKLGVGGPKLDIERIEKIRAAIGPDPVLKIDANQGWTIEEALEILQYIYHFNIAYCEAPIKARDLAGLVAIREEAPVPIMADESLFNIYDAVNHLVFQACDFFNLKLAKTGGVRSAMAILDLAAAEKIPCQIGCFTESKIGLSASVHLAIARDEIIYYDLDSTMMHSFDPTTVAYDIDSMGNIKINELPGLGIMLDNKYLDSLPKISIR
jgi:L-alanine-DL-glutamate epimerase-like enolase superfamily enzyme